MPTLAFQWGWASANLQTVAFEKEYHIRVTKGGVLSTGSSAEAREVPRFLCGNVVLLGDEYTPEEAAMAATTSEVMKRCPKASSSCVGMLVKRVYKQLSGVELSDVAMCMADVAVAHIHAYKQP